MFAVVLGYGVMLVWDVLLLHRYFPQSREHPWLFLQWVDQFLPLALTGLLTTIGLFAHLVITWCGPLGIKVKGLFYGAPYYDVPAMLAFLTILITTVNFVVSVEVNFYPTYRSYYSLLNDGGTVKDITIAEDEMLAVLNRELHYTALKQLLVTAAVISLEKTVLNALPLGFNDAMHGYFRMLCVGYALYAVGNTVMLILLYFTDYSGALTASALFAVSTVVFTVISQFFTTTLFGFGFLMGASLFAIYATFRLASYTDNLHTECWGSSRLWRKRNVDVSPNWAYCLNTANNESINYCITRNIRGTRGARAGRTLQKRTMQSGRNRKS